MVKQYKDGYFINGEWFNGMHSYDPSINAECLGINGTDGVYNLQASIIRADVIDGPHKLPYKDNITCLSDDGWGGELKYDEPYDTQYITYLFYAIAFLVVLAILFIIFA